MIVAVSLLAGLLAAFALVAGPFAGGPDHDVTAAILLGFACGWALLCARFTDRPPRRAAVAAAAMSVPAPHSQCLRRDPLRSALWAGSGRRCCLRSSSG